MASDFILDNKAFRGGPDSPTGALKKAGLVGANPAGNEGMFDTSAIMETLGYGKDAGGIDISIAGGAPGNRVQPVAADPLAAIKAKDAQITSTPTVPTIAGIRPDMVQRPTTQQAAPTSVPGAAQAIAVKQLPPGVNQFDFNKKEAAGGVVANGSRNDFSATSPLGIAGSMVDNRGRTYDEQVAHASEVNANTMRQLQNPTDKQKFDMTFVGRADASNPSYRNAMLERKVWEDNNKNNQADLTRQNAQTIAGIGAKSQNYTADQNLAGHKYTADANVKAHEATALAGVEKAKIAGTEKKQEQSQKDMKGVMDGYIKQWGGLNLPDSVKPQLHEYAKLHAYADANPDKAWIMTQSRDKQNAMIPRVLSVGGKQMDTQAIFKQLEAQHGAKEASSRVLGMVQQAGGSVQNLPNWGAFATMKQSENAIQPIAG